MSFTIREYYNTGDNSWSQVSGNTWRCQTFTTESAYTLTRVSLKLYRNGSATTGTFTISIYNTTAGLPSGTALTSYTGNVTDLGTTAAWVNIDFAVPLAVNTATLYAITASSTNNNYGIYWRIDTTGAYAGGTYVSSNDAGSSWDDNANYDFMFEVYSGEASSYVDVSGAITGSGLITGTADSTYMYVTATITGTGSITASVLVGDTVDVTGTITGTGSITGGGSGSATVTSYKPIFKKRLIAIGNDRLFYEDL